jgi:hypothetical protein
MTKESTEAKIRATAGHHYVVRPKQKKAISQVFHVVERCSDGSGRRFKVEEMYRWGRGYLTPTDVIPSNGQASVRCQIDTDYLEPYLEDGVGNFFDFDGAYSDVEKAEIRDGWNGDVDNNISYSEGWALGGEHRFNFDIEDSYILIFGGKFEVDIVDEKSGEVIARNVELSSAGSVVGDREPITRQSQFNNVENVTQNDNTCAEKCDSLRTKLIILGSKTLSVELGYDVLSTILYNLPDSSEFERVYSVLATHPSVSVREAVASKAKNNIETINLLSQDPELTVTRALVCSEGAHKALTTDMLSQLVAKDVDTAANIAIYLHRYDNADIDKIALKLSSHTDPRVRNTLAENSRAPKKILKSLLKDQDRRVRDSAKQSLE